MGTVERVALAIVGVAFVTTLILPQRQTARVIQATGQLFAQSLRAAMGR
jgi:hypothetical protein